MKNTNLVIGCILIVLAILSYANIKETHLIKGIPSEQKVGGTSLGRGLILSTRDSAFQNVSASTNINNNAHSTLLHVNEAIGKHDSKFATMLLPKFSTTG